MTDYVELPADALLDHEQPQSRQPLPGEQVDEAGNHFQLRPDGTKRLIVDVSGDNGNGFSDLPDDSQLDGEGPKATLGREAGIAARGAGEGLANLGDLAAKLNVPIQVVNQIAAQFGYTPPSAHDILTDFANKLGVPDAQTSAENYLKAGANGLASGLATAGIAPGVGLVSSALGGVGSALGSEAAKQSGAGETGQLLASIAGGLPAAASPAVLSLGRRALQELAAPITTRGATDRAASLLQQGASDVGSAVENIANRAAPVEGVQPTLAEVAGDPGLAGFQRGQTNTNLAAQRQVSERNAQNALARTTAASGTLGDGSPQAIQDLGASRVSAAEQQANQVVNDAQSGLGQAVERTGPVADRETTGAQARQQFGDAYDAARARTRAAYSAPVLQRAQPIKIPQGFFDDLRGKLDQFFGDGGGTIDPALSDILNDVSESSANTTTRTLTNIDRRLADYAGSAQMAGNRSQAAFANGVRSDLENVANQVAPPAYREALQNAKSVRAEQGRIFETGDVSRTFGNDKFGNPAVGDTEVPTRLVRPGAAGGDTADRLINAVGQDQAEGVVRQEFRRVAENANISNAKQADALASRYADAARRFPPIGQDLDAIRTAAARLDAARNGDLSTLHKAIQNSPLARVADTSVDPSTFVGQLLKRQDAGRMLGALYRQVRGEPTALDGFRRSLGDFIETGGAGPNFTASGDQIPSVNKTRAAISTVLQRGGEALTSQQKIVLKMVNRELENQNFAYTASKPAGSETALNSSFAQLVSKIPGSSKVKFLYSLLVDTLGNGQQVKDMINQAILDPDFAATLLKRPTEKHWIQAQAALRSRNAAVGAASTLRIPTPANDLSALTQSPSLAAQPQSQSDNGGNGNGQQ